MRKIKMQNKKLQITEDIDFIFEKIINKYGTGAKIDAPKEFLGRKVYVLIRKP
jgi:putative transposon-encoded protein